MKERKWDWGHREGRAAARVGVVARTAVSRGEEEAPVAPTAPGPRAGACGCVVLKVQGILGKSL